MVGQLLFGWLRYFKFWVVLDAYERGVVLRLGKHTRTIGPGLHWVWPFVHVVWTDNIVPAPAEFTISVVCADGVSAIGTGLVRWSIADIERLILGVEGRETLALNAARAAACAIAAETPWAELRTAATRRRIMHRARRQAARDGIKIESFAWGDLARARTVRLLGAPE